MHSTTTSFMCPILALVGLQVSLAAPGLKPLCAAGGKSCAAGPSMLQKGLYSRSQFVDTPEGAHTTADHPDHYDITGKDRDALITKATLSEAPTIVVAEHGDLVWLRQPDHAAYIGHCGKASCGDAVHDVYAYRKKLTRTLYKILKVSDWYTGIKHGDIVTLMSNDYSTYLGMCDNSSSCDNSSHKVQGFPRRKDRIEWVLEVSTSEQDIVYLKNVDNHSYLCLCGECHGCDHSSYCVDGCNSKTDRARIQIELASQHVAQHGQDIYLYQPQHVAFFGQCNSASCGGAVHDVYGYDHRSKFTKTQYKIERVKGSGGIRHGDSVTLMSNDHQTYLGICGNSGSCNNAMHKVLGFPNRTDRTMWILEVSTSEQGIVYFRHAKNHTYLCMCGHCGCDGSSYCVYGCKGNDDRTKIMMTLPPAIAKHGQLISLFQPSHAAYVGQCNFASCGGAVHNVYAYKSKQGRTQYKIQRVSGSGSILPGDAVTLMSNDHHTYLGMCGFSGPCDNSIHKVLGFRHRADRIRWVLEASTSEQGIVYLRNADHGSYLCMCNFCGGCGGSSYCVYGCRGKNDRTKFKMLAP